MEPQNVQVETRDADVPCPDCKQTARKNTYPDRPWSETIKNAEDTTGLIGMAFCDNPECPYRDPIHWSHKT